MGEDEGEEAVVGVGEYVVCFIDDEVGDGREDVRKERFE